ncbi:MAG: T9SS type A sorting domain-containing protein [Flavobacteriales bacterium]
MAKNLSFFSMAAYVVCMFLFNTGFAAAPPINNDPYIYPMPVDLSSVAYPGSACVSQSLVGTAAGFIGYAAIVLPTGGQDRWYSFVAPGSGIRIESSTTEMDVVLELRQDNGTLLHWEADVAGIGGEILHYASLTPGDTYRVGIRSYDGVLGDYAICFKPLMPSFASDGPGAYDMCTNFKPQWTGADFYAFTFTPTGITPGISSYTFFNSQIPLSDNSLYLRHNGTYDVTIDCVYFLFDGAGNFESVYVYATQITPISIAPHASVEVKANQRCPTNLLPGTYMQGKPFVCNAVNFTVEFTKVSDCLGSSDLESSFTVNTPGPSSQLRLNFTSPQSLAANSYYRVRWRPNFGYGQGTFGNPRIIRMGGTSSEILEEESIYVEVTELDVALFPNPSTGQSVQVAISNSESATSTIKILDTTGRTIHIEQVNTSSDGIHTIHFDSKIPEGLYLVEIASNRKTTTNKLIIEN